LLTESNYEGLEGPSNPAYPGYDLDWQGATVDCFTLQAAENRKTPVPAAPTEVLASDSSYAEKVRISWEASPGATYYEIYRAEAPIYLGGVMEKTGTTSDVYFYDESAVCDTTYYYWVKAKNAFGPSKFSKFDTGIRACR
jgi:hypothetical protein